MNLVKTPLTFDLEYYNSCVLRTFGANNPDCPILKDGDRDFSTWGDVLKNCPEATKLYYVPETATDFRGIYFQAMGNRHSLDLDWCKEYEEDRDRNFDRFSSYGVADTVGQALEYLKEKGLGEDGGEYVLTIFPVFKKYEPADGGWRWHKWGPYIGKFEHHCEYIHDESGIDMVLCFDLVPVKHRVSK